MEGVVYLPSRHGSDSDPVVRGLLAHELVHARGDRQRAATRDRSQAEEAFADRQEAAVRHGGEPGPRLVTVTGPPLPDGSSPGRRTGLTSTAPDLVRGPGPVAPDPGRASGPPSVAAPVHRAPEAPPLPEASQDGPVDGEHLELIHRLLTERLRDESLLMRERTGSLTELVWR